MSKEKVNYFLMTNGKYFPTTALPALRQQLEDLSEEQLVSLYSLEFRDPTMVFILSFFICGVDRMLIGQIGLGVLKLLTAGGCGIWWIIDLFLITDETRKYNLNKLQEALMLLR